MTFSFVTFFQIKHSVFTVYKQVAVYYTLRYYIPNSHYLKQLPSNICILLFDTKQFVSMNTLQNGNFSKRVI